jgi:competence ComEA-like helix-hairpin-helix protein
MKRFRVRTLAPLILFGTCLPFMGAMASKHEPLTKPHHAVSVHKKSVSAIVDVNVANAKSLATLKGIGVKKANAIVAYRKAHGRFKSLNDLAAIHGISLDSVQRIEKNNPGRLVVHEDT